MAAIYVAGHPLGYRSSHRSRFVFPHCLCPVKDAIDEWSEKRVSADEVARHRSLQVHRYFCPGCGAPVIFRRGPNRAPHFAHQPGHAVDDCAYYFPGENDWAGSGGTVTSAGPPPLGLYIAVQSRAHDRPEWRLSLAIPRSQDDKGEVRIRDGIAGTVVLPCALLQQQGKRVDVKAGSEAYRVEASPDVEPEYAERVTAITSGLDADVGTVFRSGPEGGRRLGEHIALHWGWAYLVVWPRQLRVQWPEAVWYETLEENAGYRAAWIELPTEADQATEQWTADFLARRIEHPSVTLSVITPITSIADDDAVTVSLGEEIVLGIIREAGAAPPRALALTYDSGVTRRLPFQSTDAVTLVTLGRLPVGRFHVTIEGAEDEDATLLLDVRPQANEADLPVAEIELQPSPSARGTEDGVITMPLYSHAAREMLESVRAGSAVIARVVLPSRVPCHFRVRPSVDSEWEQSEYANTGASTSVLGAGSVGGLAALADLLELGTRNGAEVEIDAGAFGRLHLPVRDQLASPEIHTVERLQPAMRARIQWLLSVADSTLSAKNGEQVPTSRDLAQVLRRVADLVRGDDRHLLQRLRNRQLWPRSIEPHLRLLAKSLRADIE